MNPDRWLEDAADRYQMEDLERDDNRPDLDTIAEMRRENDEALRDEDAGK